MAKRKTTKRKVTFSYAASHAKSVLLAGSFTEWQKSPVRLEQTRNGVWKKTVMLAPGRYQYRLLVDGQWCDDPQCAAREPNEFGGQNCVCVVDGV